MSKCIVVLVVLGCACAIPLGREREVLSDIVISEFPLSSMEHNLHRGISLEEPILRRKKRFIQGPSDVCQKGYVWLKELNRCVTLEDYKLMTDDDY